MSSRWIGGLTRLALAAAAAGCGDGKPPPGPPLAKPSAVHGRIAFADKSPLRGGVVYFTPVEVKAGGKVRYEGASLVDAKGEYKVGFNGDGAGVAPGEYRVWVTPRELNELKNSNSKRIPVAYREPKTTPLTITVGQEENTVDIVLK